MMHEGHAMGSSPLTWDGTQSRRPSGEPAPISGAHGRPVEGDFDYFHCQVPAGCAKLLPGGCAIMRSDMATGSKQGWGVEAIAAL
jgi:hypothetical protein